MNKWRWQDYLAMFFGAWIAASPWVFGFPQWSVATWSAVIVGCGILVLAAFDLDWPSRTDEWAMAGLGAWSVVSPWVLGFAGDRAAATSMVVSGVAVIALTVWELFSGDGWRKPGNHAHGH